MLSKPERSKPIEALQSSLSSFGTVQPDNSEEVVKRRWNLNVFLTHLFARKVHGYNKQPLKIFIFGIAAIGRNDCSHYK